MYNALTCFILKTILHVVTKIYNIILEIFLKYINFLNKIIKKITDYNIIVVGSVIILWS